MIISDKTLLLDGYDNCLEGICIRFGQEPVAIYNYEKIIEQLMADGMTWEDAVEWFDFNMIGAWVGETTPAYIVKDYEFEETL